MEVPKFTAIAVTPRHGGDFQVIYALGEDGRVWVWDFNHIDDKRGWRTMSTEVFENKKAAQVGG
jgi:hypothetical protein